MVKAFNFINSNPTAAEYYSAYQTAYSAFSWNWHIKDVLTDTPIFNALLRGSNAGVPINIAPVIGYQLCCFEYQTNDKVDFIFTAEDYRNLFEAWNHKNGQRTYVYNAYELPVDGFSHIVLSDMFADA